MDNITHLSPAPVGVHAFFVGEKPGEVRSEPLMAVVVMQNSDPASLDRRVVRVLVMAKVGSDELALPGDLGGYLGVGRLQDQAFWEDESTEWFAAQKRERKREQREKRRQDQAVNELPKDKKAKG